MGISGEGWTSGPSPSALKADGWHMPRLKKAAAEHPGANRPPGAEKSLGIRKAKRARTEGVPQNEMTCCGQGLDSPDGTRGEASHAFLVDAAETWFKGGRNQGPFDRTCSAHCLSSIAATSDPWVVQVSEHRIPQIDPLSGGIVG